MAEMGRVVKVNCFFAIFLRAIRGQRAGLLPDQREIGPKCGQNSGHISSLMIRYRAAVARGVCTIAGFAAGLLRSARAKGSAGIGCALVAIADFIQRGVFIGRSCIDLFGSMSGRNGALVWRCGEFLTTFNGARRAIKASVRCYSRITAIRRP
jgi:hypothetical protein